MPRESTMWWREATQCYYTTINRKKVRLSAKKSQAKRMLRKLLVQQDEGTKHTGVFPSFKKIADLFLDNSLETKKLNTYRMHKYLLQSFCDFIGKKKVSDLKVHHVSDWLAQKKPRAEKWNQSTSCSGRSSILACLNWAVTEGRLSSHPLGKLKRGSHKKRERVLTAEERKLIRDNVKPDFRDFLFALEHTGARPFSEMAPLTAAMIDWKAQTVTLQEHKTSGKGKKRTLYLTPELLTILRRLADRYPEGPLFRNMRDGEWTSHDATRRLHYVMEKLKLPRATVYAYRHTFITEALEKGMTSNLVAELVGNSPLTIARNYDHLSQKTATMLDAARRAVG